MFFVVMVYEMRVCFSKNAPVIKVVETKTITYHPIARIHQKSLKLRKVSLLNLEKVNRKVFASILESYLEDILWIYYMKLLNAKIKHLFLVSCKKVFPENIVDYFLLKYFFLVTPIKSWYHESYDGRKLINFEG